MPRAGCSPAGAGAAVPGGALGAADAARPGADGATSLGVASARRVWPPAPSHRARPARSPARPGARRGRGSVPAGGPRRPAGRRTTMWHRGGVARVADTPIVGCLAPGLQRRGHGEAAPRRGPGAGEADEHGAPSRFLAARRRRAGGAPGRRSPTRRWPRSARTLASRSFAEHLAIRTDRTPSVEARARRSAACSSALQRLQ